MHISSLRNNSLQELNLIKMIIARFVGTGGFLMRYEINTSPIKSPAINFNKTLFLELKNK
jgi:hypothetical protein